MKLLTRFFLMMLVAVGALQAADTQGYIGNQSFRLTDDSELNNVSNRADSAKVDFARYEQNQNQIGEQVRTLEAQQRSIAERMNILQRDVDALRSLRNSLDAKLTELKKTPDVNAEAIAVTIKEIANVDAQILEKNKQAGALKLESGPVNVRLDQVRNDFNLAARKTEDARQRYMAAARARDEYRDELLNAIRNINAEGARIGQRDGEKDGADLSLRMGNDMGDADGKSDGFNQGTLDGQNSYYTRGAAVGEREGSLRANSDGQRDGTKEGTDSGNRSAGNREGRAAGIKRADGSDAAQVGINQGKKAGLERAVSTGQVDGRNIGEQETTKKLESGELKSVNLDGSFAGSFARRAPAYPGDFNGSTYRPEISHSKEVLRKAYTDGYVFTYRQYTRFEFQRRIDADYNLRYDSSYRMAYEDANRREYPNHYAQGRRDGDARAYGRDYPIFKAEAFKIAFDQLNSSPNRSSAEFKNSYASAELSAYNERYEIIRSANFVNTEAATFAANIAAQTEIYRQKRTNEVNAIYNSNAVLEFVSSEMLDGGIKGIALLDGVFQPGETTNHNVVLRNYGFKDAANVTVALQGGQSVRLPTIPARSIVTVKGAAQGSINLGIGNAFKSSLSLVSPLTSQDAVEGRHYDSIPGGLVKADDQKAVRVAYPLALSGLNVESQLLKGAKNKLKITLTNNSKREYKGELQIKLATNSQQEIITKGFDAVTSLQSSANLSDAEILIESEEDAYRDLSISAEISQNGVLLGVLPQNFVTMAKAKFADKGKVPVLVANTDAHLRAFRDALETLGGSEKVSILDLSLAALNAQAISSGLSQKVLLIVDDERGSSISTLATFIGKSKTSAFVFIDENSTGVRNALSLPTLKDVTKLSLGKRPVFFTNAYRGNGVDKASALIQSSLQDFPSDLKLAQTLALSSAEHVAELKTEITPENFSTPNESLKVYSLKALSEIVSINLAYDKSGGVFSRDKKYMKLIENDSVLFHNQLKATVAGGVVVSKLPVILSAIAMREFLISVVNRGDISAGILIKTAQTLEEVLKDMDDSYSKDLKKNFRDVYNKGNEYRAAHNPYFVPAAN